MTIWKATNYREHGPPGQNSFEIVFQELLTALEATDNDQCTKWLDERIDAMFWRPSPPYVMMQSEMHEYARVKREK